MRGPQSTSPTALPTSRPPKTAVTARERSFLQKESQQIGALFWLAPTKKECPFHCCAAGCGRLLQDLVMASTLLLSCCISASCSSCSAAALHNMGTSRRLQVCVSWPYWPNSTHSGIRRAITFVADDGARPSPSPTCRAEQAGISGGHLHRPFPAQQAVASASLSIAIASSPRRQALCCHCFRQDATQQDTGRQQRSHPSSPPGRLPDWVQARRQTGRQQQPRFGQCRCPSAQVLGGRQARCK